MKKITGLDNQLRMVGGGFYVVTEGKTTRPALVREIIVESINTHSFPQKATPTDITNMNKLIKIGERINEAGNEITLEDADIELLKMVVNPPLQRKVAAIVVQVLEVIQNAEVVEITPGGD